MRDKQSAKPTRRRARRSTQPLGGFVHELHHIPKFVLSELASLGVSKLDEEWHPQSFGSGRLVLGRGEPELRLVWDGKDGWAYLQAVQTGGKWSDIYGLITEGDFHAGVPDSAKLRSMADAGRRALP
jgi:hypothetical protein